MTREEAENTPLLIDKKLTLQKVLEVEAHGLSLSDSAYLLRVTPQRLGRFVKSHGIEWRGKKHCYKYGVDPDSQRQAILASGLPESTVYARMYRKNLTIEEAIAFKSQKKSAIMNRTWTDEQEQYLVAHYATTSNAELAAALGKKNADRVMAKASLLGLKKSRQFLKESCQQRENSGKFKKGMTPHNKGKKLSEETKAKLVKTMFKSGNRPHNTLQVGAETQDKDMGMLWSK